MVETKGDVKIYVALPWQPLMLEVKWYGGEGGVKSFPLVTSFSVVDLIKAMTVFLEVLLMFRLDALYYYYSYHLVEMQANRFKLKVFAQGEPVTNNYCMLFSFHIPFPVLNCLLFQR